MTEAVFYSLWKPLMQYAQSHGVDNDTAQDLVMETIQKVIDQFIPERGDILHFAYQVLSNRMKNHFRKINKSVQLIDEHQSSAPSPHDYAVMNEQEQRAKNILGSLKQQLNESEFKLLNILQAQMEEKGKYNVSLAARSIGIEALKAHDMLRKIQRKLNILISDVEDISISRKSSSVKEDSLLEYSMLYDLEHEYQELITFAADFHIYERISNYLNKNRS